MTEKPKWTEGEWRVQGDPLNGRNNNSVWVSCQDGQHIARVYDPDNAHLLAASKKLYEALEPFAEWLDDEPFTKNYPDDQDAQIGGWDGNYDIGLTLGQFRRAKEALKQARGETMEPPTTQPE